MAAKVSNNELAMKFASLHGDRYAYDPEADCWRLWQGRYWDADPEDGEPWTAHMLALSDAYSLATTMAQSQDALRCAAVHMRRRFPMSAEYLSFTNGDLHIPTLTLQPADRAHSLTLGLPYAYLPDQPTPLIDACLTWIFPTPFEQRCYLAHIGLALISDRSMCRALCLWGPRDSGKTTLLRLANMTCGQPPRQNCNPMVFGDDLEAMRAREKIWDGYLAVFDEFPEAVLRQEDMFKLMCSHQAVSGRAMRAEPRDTVWGPKLLFATNDPPVVSDRSGAVEKRLLIVRLSPPALDREEMVFDYEETLAGELPGFAARCIWEGRATRQAKEYPYSLAMTEQYQEITEGSDPIKLFVATQCRLDPAAEIEVSELYSPFRQWCRDHGFNEMSSATFSRRLTEYGAWRITRRRTERIRFLRGIALLLDEDRGISWKQASNTELASRVQQAGATLTMKGGIVHLVGEHNLPLDLVSECLRRGQPLVTLSLMMAREKPISSLLEEK